MTPIEHFLNLVISGVAAAWLSFMLLKTELIGSLAKLCNLFFKTLLPDTRSGVIDWLMGESGVLRLLGELLECKACVSGWAALFCVILMKTPHALVSWFCAGAIAWLVLKLMGDCDSCLAGESLLASLKAERKAKDQSHSE